MSSSPIGDAAAVAAAALTAAGGGGLGARRRRRGSVLDYLPVAPMAEQHEGPIIACDTSEHEVRALPPGEALIAPSLPETLYSSCCSDQPTRGLPPSAPTC